jgi:glycosyltransferase involved in cell wall biosynthesis
VNAFPAVWIVGNLPPPVHGPALYTKQLVEALGARGITVRVFRVGARGALEDVERPSMRKVALDLLALLSLAWAGVGRHLSGSSPVVLYLTPSQGGMAVMRDRLVVALAAGLGLPVLAHVHGCGWLHAAARDDRSARLLTGTLRRCSTTIWLGPTYAAAAAETGLPSVGLNNAVEPQPAPTAPAPATLRLELLYVSNLMRSKGLWIAAEAAMLLSLTGHPVRLRCAGVWFREDERRAFLADFEAPLKNGVIELVGFADEARKKALFATSSFFLLPVENPHEGQPLSVIEAMAHGVVPLVTPVGGIPDLFRFEGGEALCNAQHRDPHGVVATVRELSDPAQWWHHSRRCHAHVGEALAWNGTVDRIVDLVQGVAAAEGEPHRVHS